MLAAGRIRLVLSRANVSSLNQNGAKILGVGPIQMPVATMSMRATHGEPYPYDPNPWPYEKKKFRMIHHLMEWTSERLNENSKVIAVEGNVAVGKHKFAERLAAEFDLKVIPAFPESDIYKLPSCNNFDLHCLDEMLPDGAQCYDLKKFLHDPRPEKGTVGKLLRNWYHRRCAQYGKALTHVLSTGQGVVVVKSPFSDDVYLEALRKMGWVTKNYVQYFKEFQEASCVEFLTPHLTIYLDASINTIRQRINQRNNPIEKNARNLTDKYLTTIDQMYKEIHLPKMRKHGEVLEIDWETEADDLDMDAIAEEVTLLKLEGEDNEDPKFHRWTQLDEEELCYLRSYYGDPVHLHDDIFLGHGGRVPWDCPEILMNPDDALVFQRVVWEHPAVLKDPGWSRELGDEVNWRVY